MKRKVLVIGDDFANPYEPFTGIFSVWKVSALSRHCEIKVISPFPWWNWLKYMKKEKCSKKSSLCDRIEGIDVFRPLYFYTPKIGRSFYGFFYFFSILACALKLRKGFRFDVIYAISAYPAGFASALLGRLFKIPVLIGAIGTDINKYTEFYWRKKWILWGLKRAARVIAVSQAIKERMILLGILGEKICVCYNGVNHDVFRPIPFKDQKEKVILYVGNLKAEKGLSELISAYALLGRKDVQLVLIGEGPYETTLRNKVQSHGIEDRVHFLGGLLQDKIADWLNRATLFCLPSYNEGLPNVVLEALACGVPVVATNVGGIPELITSEAYGLMVPRKDVIALSRKLDEGLSKAWDRNKISDYVKQFSWEENANQLLREIELALKEHD